MKIKVKVKDIRTLPSNAKQYYEDTFNSMITDGFSVGKIIEYIVRDAMVEAQLQRDYPTKISTAITEVNYDTYEVELREFK